MVDERFGCTSGGVDSSVTAALLHRDIVANVLQSEAWMNPALTKPGRDGRMLAADEEIVFVDTQEELVEYI